MSEQKKQNAAPAMSAGKRAELERKVDRLIADQAAEKAQKKKTAANGENDVNLLIHYANGGSNVACDLLRTVYRFAANSRDNDPEDEKTASTIRAVLVALREPISEDVGKNDARRVALGFEPRGGKQKRVGSMPLTSKAEAAARFEKLQRH